MAIEEVIMSGCQSDSLAVAAASATCCDSLIVPWRSATIAAVGLQGGLSFSVS